MRSRRRLTTERPRAGPPRGCSALSVCATSYRKRSWPPGQGEGEGEGEGENEGEGEGEGEG